MQGRVVDEVGCNGDGEVLWLGIVGAFVLFRGVS